MRQQQAEAEAARHEYRDVLRPELQDVRDQSEADQIRQFLIGEGPRFMEFDIRSAARERQAIRDGRTGAEFRIAQEDVSQSGGNTVPTSFSRTLLF